MAMVFFQNTGLKPKTFGLVTVYPGAVREVDDRYLKQKNSEINFDLAAFVKQRQDDEIEQLPSLTDYQFELVYDHYANNKAPQKLRPALDEERALRDARLADIAFAETLKTLEVDDLGLMALEADDEKKLALINAELDSRG